MNPDVKLKEDLATYNDKDAIDSNKKQSLAIIKRQNFSMMNVRKNKTAADKNHIWILKTLMFLMLIPRKKYKTRIMNTMI
jgi:hypothetical protein